MTIDSQKMMRAIVNAGQQHWYSIRNESAGETSRATVHLYDAIGGWFGVTAKDFVDEINALDVDEIELHINSPGGDVYDGIAIRNSLKAHKAKVTAIVDGLAASAASYIALAGDEVVMAPNSELMIHDAWGLCIGAATDMEDMRAQLDRISNNIATMYADKAGGEAKTWREAMLAETWYSAEEAVTAGLADRVDGKEPEDKAASNRFDLSVFAHAGRSAAPAPAYLPAAALAAPKPPAAPAAGSTPPAAPAASGDTTQEGEAAMFTDEQLNHLRQTVGVADDADGDTIVAAVREALEERAADAPAASAPGSVQLDQGTYDQLVSDAQAGRQARDEQLRNQREALVQAAVTDGRIPPARRDHWVNLLEADPGAADVLANLAKGTVPLDELGHAGGGSPSNSEADKNYSALFPEEA